MVFVSPYVTDRFTAYAGDTITTNLSLAVWLKDEYTEKEPIGYLKVRVKEGDIKAIKNLSGYYCFNDLSDGNYNLIVESEFYFPISVVEGSVTIPLPAPKKPVKEIVLKPRPYYPFSTTTLVRGVVIKGNKPVVNATVEVVGKTIKTSTDEKGEFVLYFKGIKKEVIKVRIKKDSKSKIVSVTIEEGKTISTGVIAF